jgi:hypothetical protein
MDAATDASRATDAVKAYVIVRDAKGAQVFGIHSDEADRLRAAGRPVGFGDYSVELYIEPARTRGIAQRVREAFAAITTRP